MARRSAVLIIVIVAALQAISCGSGGSDTSSSGSYSPPGGSPPPGEGPPPEEQTEYVLRWTAPAARADDSPMAPSELSGFTVYMGTSVADMTAQDVDMSSCEASGTATRCSHNLGILAPGRWFFAVSARDTDGREGGYSRVVNETII